MTRFEYDVAVMGAGPAGATVAALVAREGWRTLLVERSPTPAFKVGESLMPATYWTLQRLGVLDQLRASSFPVKASVQFFSPDGRANTPFYFEDHEPHESSRTWQVLRSDFDDLLVRRADADGAEVRRGTTVQRVRFEGARATSLDLKAESGANGQITARVIVDATGQRALLARQRQRVEPNPCLQHASFYTHFSGAVRDTGRDEGATLILHTEPRRSWFWFIPLPEDRVSVGVVGSVDHLVRERGGEPQAVFEEELERCPALRARLENAVQLMPMRVIRDYSYQIDKMAGDGWVAVGDAAGFIDPIYSTGVFLALQSGEMAADSICAALAEDDVSAKRLGAFVPEFERGMNAMRQLVYAFYTPHFSFAEFVKRHPDCRGELVDLLMGNVYRKSVDRLLAALGQEMSRESVSESPSP